LTVKTFRSSRPGATEVKPEVIPEVSLDATVEAIPEVKPEVKLEVKPELPSEATSKDEAALAEVAESRVTLEGQVSEEDAWTDVLDTVAKIVPLLRSKLSDTRSAAAFTLGLLANSLPAWSQPSAPTSSSTWTSSAPLSDPIALPELLRDGQTLLASAGREYVAKPTGGDKAKRRKAMMGSLGLGDAVGWGDDVDKVIGEEDDEVTDQAQTPKGMETPKSTGEVPKDVFEGLSARQIVMLKRKKGNLVEEANK
jgi:TATA-binding protein-associated factor